VRLVLGGVHAVKPGRNTMLNAKHQDAMKPTSDWARVWLEHDHRIVKLVGP